MLHVYCSVSPLLSTSLEVTAGRVLLPPLIHGSGTPISSFFMSCTEVAGVGVLPLLVLLLHGSDTLMSLCFRWYRDMSVGGVFLLPFECGYGTAMSSTFMICDDFLPNDLLPVSVLSQVSVFGSFCASTASSSGLTEPSLKVTSLESESPSSSTVTSVSLPRA